MAIGVLIALAIVLPNVLWWTRPPVDAAPPPAPRRPAWVVLTWLESLARIGVVAIPVGSRVGSTGLFLGLGTAVMVLAWTLYMICWARYWRRGREVRWLYAPYCGIPVPMALAPAAYFAAASVVLASPWMALAAIAFGVSHIPLSVARRGQL